MSALLGNETLEVPGQGRLRIMLALLPILSAPMSPCEETTSHLIVKVDTQVTVKSEPRVNRRRERIMCSRQGLPRNDSA
jgi:hypothetical protein